MRVLRSIRRGTPRRGTFARHGLASAWLAVLLLVPGMALAQRDMPMGPDGYPVAPTGLEGRELPTGPLHYRTAENQDIRVTVVARMAWPYGLAALPDGDLLIAQRTGEMKRILRGTTGAVEVPGGPAALFLGSNGPPVLHGYMQIALHPQFARNGLLYLAYTKAPDSADGMVSAVARARYAAGALHEVQDIWIGDGFFGPVAVAVSPDHKVYIAVSGLGDDVAQDPRQSGGKVLRLNEDGSVPADNPFVGRDGWRPEIYTLGHRSTSALAVHPVSGEVYLSEMGPNGGDEINLIKAGANYGWPLVSLGRTYPGPWQATEAARPTHAGFEPPLLYWMPSISTSGLAFYQGDALAKWKGDLFVGGLRYGEVPGTGRLERVLLNQDMQELRRETLLADLNQRIRDVEAGPDGVIHVATDHEDGAILRIEPAP